MTVLYIYLEPACRVPHIQYIVCTYVCTKFNSSCDLKEYLCSIQVIDNKCRLFIYKYCNICDTGSPFVLQNLSYFFNKTLYFLTINCIWTNVLNFSHFVGSHAICLSSMWKGRPCQWLSLVEIQHACRFYPWGSLSDTQKGLGTIYTIFSWRQDLCIVLWLVSMHIFTCFIKSIFVIFYQFSEYEQTVKRYQWEYYSTMLEKVTCYLIYIVLFIQFHILYHVPILRV